MCSSNHYWLRGAIGLRKILSGSAGLEGCSIMSKAGKLWIVIGHVA